MRIVHGFSRKARWASYCYSQCRFSSCLRISTRDSRSTWFIHEFIDSYNNHLLWRTNTVVNVCLEYKYSRMTMLRLSYVAPLTTTSRPPPGPLLRMELPMLPVAPHLMGAFSTAFLQQWLYDYLSEEDRGQGCDVIRQFQFCSTSLKLLQNKCLGCHALVYCLLEG